MHLKPGTHECADCGAIVLPALLNDRVTVYLDGRVETVEIINVEMDEETHEGTLIVSATCPGIARPGDPMHGSGCKAGRMAIHDFVCTKRPERVPTIVGNPFEEVH